MASAAESSMSSGEVCVLGAGVVGLTAALRIKQLMPGVGVTVVAELWGADTTSDGAAGLWKPFTLGAAAEPALVQRWGQATLDHYLQLYQSPQAAAAGTILTAAYQLWRRPVPDPDWAAAVPHFRLLTGRELAAYDVEGTHAHGWSYTTVITEGRLYMAWLVDQLRGAGVALQTRRIESLEQLAAAEPAAAASRAGGSGGSSSSYSAPPTTYDAVVNCSGLGARALFGDTSMYPVRGHVVRVRAPWVGGRGGRAGRGGGDVVEWHVHG